MYCKHCGFRVPDGAEFCDNCGHRMNGGGLFERLDSLREDDITHAGEQPRRTDLFPDKNSAAEAAGVKKKAKLVKKSRPSKSAHTGNDEKRANRVRLGIGLIIVLIIIIINVIDILFAMLD